MHVFIAGGTGVIGRRTVARLVANGVEVTGLARSERAAARLTAAGARPVRVDLFDPEPLRRAVAGHDAVVNLATAIPTGAAAGTLRAWELNHRIRREGSRNLVDAALAAGAERYVQESIALLYADGDGRWLDESAPVTPTFTTAASLEAEAQADRITAAGGAGIALRFAYFYGPDSAHTRDEVAAARDGVALEMGPAAAYRPEVTTDDAAAAVVAALLRGPAGLYNVADDRPVPRADYYAALAEAAGIPAPPVPGIAAAVPGEFAALQWSQRVSNLRFVAATGWRPRYPSVWEGWRFVTQALDAPVAEELAS